MSLAPPCRGPPSLASCDQRSLSAHALGEIRKVKELGPTRPGPHSDPWLLLMKRHYIMAVEVLKLARAEGVDDVRIRKRLEDETHPDRATLIDFLRVLSVSHTVVPEGDQTKASKIKYQAESPDEGALVLAAKCLGFFFCDKVCS